MLRSLALMAVLVSAGGCATMTVSSHVAPQLDVRPYRTFSWGLPDALPAGDPRLEENTFFKDHIEGAVERQLARHGLTIVGDGGDLQMHYHAVITPRLDVNRLDRDRGACIGEICDPPTIEYEQGTLILDIVDTATGRLIWRGWAQHAIEPALRSRDRMARDIEDAVRRMLDRFPRAL